MKPLVSTRKLWILLAVLGALGATAADAGEVSWFSNPKATPNGWYWAYDDAETSPPFAEPVLAPMPAGPYSEHTIHDTLAANRLSPYNDEPYMYTLPDSFWYYGYWFEPGAHLYISPDGWISFHNLSEEGFPNPPSASPPFPNVAAPNMIIAPLWADYDPTRTLGSTDSNRVYYLYHTNTNSLIVEWYKIQGRASGNAYTFQVQIQLGGQELLSEYANCGVVFSYHFIHFIYNTASAGWAAESGATGFEDPDGLKGVTYMGTINTSGDDFHAIRAGYKRVFAHDVAADMFFSPGHIVLRYTPIEPKVVVANIGEETEHLTVNLDITIEGDDGDPDTVYHHILGSYDLFPGQKDTLTAPCWEPEEFGNLYTKILRVYLDRDECLGNDMLIDTSFVGCDDTVRFASDFGWGWWGLTNSHQIGTFIEADGGLMVTGGRIPNDDLSNDAWVAALWGAQNGCGLPSDPALATAVPDVDTPWTIFTFQPGAVFVPAATPGNIWVGAIPISSVNSALFIALRPLQQPTHPCYQGEGIRTAFRDYGTWSWPEDLSWYEWRESGLSYIFHMGFGHYPFSPRPAPPCWEGGLHDLTCFRIEEPNINYVEDGVAITPELAVANLGYQVEPDSGFFHVTFLVVDPETEDTVFADTTLENHIGWMGDDGDDPDTVIVAITPWTPQSECSDSSSITAYELIGLVRLGKIGPDFSDHCPYNDTLRRTVECLLSHDVGVPFMRLNDEKNYYPPGSYIRIYATVENFGYHAEHDIEVRCEIRDVDSGGVLLWHELQAVEFLDWRGNVLGRPYSTELVFGDFITPTDHHMIIEIRTELVGDDCPDNDRRTRHLNSGVLEEQNIKEFSLLTSNALGFSGLCRVRFAAPYSGRVKIDVLDINGRLVKTLAEDVVQPGHHCLEWKGIDDAGRKVSAGIYLIRMEADEFSDVQKIILLR
jgi:hypothetical protein